MEPDSSAPVVSAICENTEEARKLIPTQKWQSMTLDLLADVKVVLRPGDSAWVPTGVALRFPTNYVGLVLGRDEHLAVGIEVVPGLIDNSDAVDVLKVRVKNVGTQPYVVYRLMKIASLVVIPAIMPEVCVDVGPPGIFAFALLYLLLLLSRFFS